MAALPPGHAAKMLGRALEAPGYTAKNDTRYFSLISANWGNAGQGPNFRIIFGPNPLSPVKSPRYYQVLLWWF